MTDTVTRNYFRVETIRRMASAKKQRRDRSMAALRNQMAAYQNAMSDHWGLASQQSRNPYRLLGGLLP